jgi:general stress protein YciG
MSRGFAAMSKDKLRAASSKGGKRAQESGTGHRWNSEEARLAGLKGGASVSSNRDHMANIGRMGGRAKKAS